MRSSLRYFLAFLGLLAIEICIAIFFTDTFIRPILGDFLVVILVYCFLMSVSSLFYPRPNFHRKKFILLATLLFAIGVETLQAFPFIKMIGLEENRIAKIILGSVFDWWDILAYVLGVIVVYCLEYWYENLRQ